MKFCIDIDDTILYSEVDENGEYKLVGTNIKLINKINRLHFEGHTIILWTGRHWNHLETTINHLKKSHISYDTLLMGKPPVDYYVDDKAIRPDEFLKLEIK